MKLVFSEAAPDYANYVFPYVVWGFPERGETAADFFEAGFLPSSVALDRFYLCRQLRVPLSDWKPSSENRRILRKGAGFRCELVDRQDFDYSPARREGWLAYADARFGPGVMPPARLDKLMSAPVISHLLHFTDESSGADAGTVLLHLEAPRVALYYYAFYDRALAAKNLGMLMMTRAAEFFAAAGVRFLHLGTCYHERALYKTQFEPLEFFNGFRWSRNLDELKHLIRQQPTGQHRLETEEFIAFQPEGLEGVAETSPFRISPA